MGIITCRSARYLPSLCLFSVLVQETMCSYGLSSLLYCVCVSVSVCMYIIEKFPKETACGAFIFHSTEPSSLHHFEIINPGLVLSCEVRGCTMKGETLGGLVPSFSFPLPSLLSLYTLTGIQRNFISQTIGKTALKALGPSYLPGIWIQVPC